MTPVDPNNPLRLLVEELGRPFDSPEELRTLALKLDAIAGALIRTPYVATRIRGPISDHLSQTFDLPTVLRLVREQPFAEVAPSAEDLLNFSRASIVDFGLAEDDMALANGARQRFYDKFVELLQRTNLV